MLFEKFSQKLKVMLSFGQKAVISSLTKHQIQKLLLQKLFSLVCYLRIFHENWKLSSHLVTNQSFCHHQIKKLYYKIYSVCYELDNLTKKVKVKLLFGHKAVISSFSKLCIFNVPACGWIISRHCRHSCAVLSTISVH